MEKKKIHFYSTAAADERAAAEQLKECWKCSSLSENIH